MLDKAVSAREDLESLYGENQLLPTLLPAADEPASRAYNNQLTWNGQSGAFGHGIEHVRLECEYLSSLIGALREALHMIPESDDRRRGEINQASDTAGGGFL
jgi:hypothetical protein